jgi:hypothetical protein
VKDYYFSYRHIHNTVKRSANVIAESGFEPDIILAIGAGGFIPARILRTFIKKPIATIAVSYYDNENQPTDLPRKQQWLDKVDIRNRKILLVDEVDDTRATLEYCLLELLKQQPAEIAVFVLHSKIKPKRGHYPLSIQYIFVGEHLDDKWIRYPWDALDIDEHERYAESARA